ncbi:hypothetical protein PIB30_093410 [Stylosanthes scabra]|uniref:Uncharacterized protein n=1 Tax=Stylosanthes scabra TaxID=79078 RepID=A0ABU6QVV9_9FABA|nr:hypothetical protein [Stylosanthes scabra]
MLKQELSTSRSLPFAGNISRCTFVERLAGWLDAVQCIASDWVRYAVPLAMGVHSVQFRSSCCYKFGVRVGAVLRGIGRTDVYRYRGFRKVLHCESTRRSIRRNQAHLAGIEMLRGTLEAQRLEEVSHAFSGRSLTWFQLWSHRNPHADWDTFDLAFLHQFEPAVRPLLPEICWNKVENWEIKWEEIKARQQEQQQQSQVIQDTTQFQSSTQQEIQARTEEDQEIKHKIANRQFCKDELEENPKILDQENFQTIHIHTNSPSQLQVEGEAGALRNATDIIDQDPNPNTAEQQLISQFNSKKNRSEFQSITKLTGKRQDEENMAQLHELGSVHGDVTGGFKPVSAGEWSELAGVVVLQRPPPEPPDLVLLVKLTDAGRLRSMDNDGGQDVGSKGAGYAEYSVVKEEKQRRTVTTLVNGAATVEGGSASVTGGVSDYVGVLHGNAVAKEEGVTDLLEGGDNLQLGGDRGISNNIEINDVARENGDITVNEGDGWGQSGTKDDYSSGADPSLLLTVTPIVSSFAGSSVFTTRGANVSRLNHIRPFLGKPPKLLATVLPWNRHSPGAESDDNEGGMPGIRKHEEHMEPDLKSYAVTLGEPKTVAFMMEATP